MSMKRLFFSIFLLILLCWTSFAIDRKTAQKVAENVLNVKRSENLVLVNSPFTKSEAKEDFSPFYIFNGEKGFVIVAGYEAAHPVLAYSETDHFDYDHIPESMNAFLDIMSDVILSAKSGSLRPSREIQAEWSLYLSGTKSTESEVLLETAHWDQGNPYNRKCPIHAGMRSYTGCSNTATAIIMRYHKWPEKGVGTLPDYKNYVGGQEVTFPGHSLGHTYDWDNMPTFDIASSNQNVSDYQKDQVAQLMYDVGIMNQSGYSSRGTAAGLNEYGLVAYFNYDTSIQPMNRADFNRDLEWERVIKNEIDSSRPIYYGVELNSGGYHAVVIDGYKGRLFHINFGWGGSSDAYMVVTPVDGEESLVTRNYRASQHMVIGIQPNRGDASSVIKIISLTITNSYWDQTANGFNYKSGEDFFVNTRIANYSAEDKSLTVAYGLVNGDGNIEEIISATCPITVMSTLNDEWSPNYPAGYFYELCVINSELRSDHTIQLCQQKDGGWQILPSADDGVFHLGHSGQLRQLSELEFEKSIPDDAEWERVSFHVPSDALLTIATEDGQIVYNDYARNSFPPLEKEDLRIAKYYGTSGAYNGFIVVDKKRSSPPQTIFVTISDLIETASFSLTL